MQDRQLVDDPVKWLSTPSRSEYSAEWWKKMFANTFSQNIIRVPVAFPSLTEYTLSRWKWATPGATRFSHLLLDGQKQATKFGAAVSLTDAELLDHVAQVGTASQPEIGVFLKPDEPGYKRRLIANVPLGAYIVASYIRDLFIAYVGLDPTFMKLSPSNQDKIDCVQLLREGRTAMPLDESAYDYHVTRESWTGFFDFLKSTFPGMLGPEKLEQFFNTAIWSFDGQKGRWLSGMPSGLALTSYLNSWMNYIKQITITPGDLAWAAGDDVLTFPDRVKDLHTVADEYGRFGSDVNAKKNWLSQKYAEYLKVLYGVAGTSGYPARLWGTLMWAGVDRTFLPSDKLPELAELWKQFFDRIGIVMPTGYVACDLAAAVSKKVQHFGAKEGRLWLHAPRVHGGFGMLPYSKATFTWHMQVERNLKYENALIRLPRVTRYTDKVTLVVGESNLKHMDYRTGQSLHLPPVNSLAEWERRLNGEDNPIKGPFRTMALDVIPLPTLPFVSTSNMASFAAQWGFNALPNITGEWSKIADRLIAASLGLAQLVAGWTETQSISTWC